MMISGGVPHWFAGHDKPPLDVAWPFSIPFLMSIEFSVVPACRARSVVKSAFSNDSMKI